MQLSTTECFRTARPGCTFARVSFIIRHDAVHGYHSHDEVWPCVVSM